MFHVWDAFHIFPTFRNLERKTTGKISFSNVVCVALVHGRCQGGGGNCPPPPKNFQLPLAYLSYVNRCLGVGRQGFTQGGHRAMTLRPYHPLTIVGNKIDYHQQN